MPLSFLGVSLSLSASVPALTAGQTTVIGQVPPGAGAVVTRNGTALAASSFTVSGAGVVSLVGTQLTRGDVITVSAVRTGSAATGSVPAPPITGFVSRGDSLTNGYLSSNNATKSYPAVLGALTGLSFTNNGVVGDKLLNMDANYASNDAALYSAVNRNLYIIWGGINDISAGTTLSQLQTALQSITGKARATGYLVAAATITPSNYSGTTDAQRTVRTQFNSWLAANWASFADVLIDFAGDPRLSDTTNTTYFNSDQLHFTDAGYAAAADVARNALKIPFASAATAYTLTGSSVPTIGTASTYTLATNGPLSSAVTVSIAASPDGTLSASSVTLPAGSTPSATFTYTPTTSGAKTLTVTNNGGLTNPAAAALTVAAAATGPVFSATTIKGTQTLSNGNRTTTFPAGGTAVTAAAISGKKLFAMSMDTFGSGGGFNSIGVCTLNATDSPGFGSNDGSGPGYYNNGSIYLRGSQVGSPPSFIAGAQVGIVVDETAALFWATKDGTNFYGTTGPLTAAQVAAGTGGVSLTNTKANGTMYGAYGCGISGSSATLLAWPSGWTVPSGFSSM